MTLRSTGARGRLRPVLPPRVPPRVLVAGLVAGLHCESTLVAGVAVSLPKDHGQESHQRGHPGPERIVRQGVEVEGVQVVLRRAGELQVHPAHIVAQRPVFPLDVHDEHPVVRVESLRNAAFERPGGQGAQQVLNM